MSALVGETKETMRRIFGVGSDYFPEVLWKVYVVNAPFSVRMGWSVVKVMIHPVTQTKINIVGSHSETVTTLKSNGFRDCDLPPEFGGTNRGMRCFEMIRLLQQ